MRPFSLLPVFFFLAFSSCGKTSSTTLLSTWQQFAARDQEHSRERPMIYRALVPSHWIRKDPVEYESIADTTKAICEFYIREKGENGAEIRLTIHTFPILKEEERIPPQAQIARWKKQFEDLDVLSTQIIPESHGGFSGLYFEGSGTLKNQPTKMLGWSMQLAPLFARELSLIEHPLDSYKLADYTIKATGSPDFIHQNSKAIRDFAGSFEFIEELPSPI